MHVLVERSILTAEVVFAVLVCIGTGFTGFRTSGVGRLFSKVATADLSVNIIMVL